MKTTGEPPGVQTIIDETKNIILTNFLPGVDEQDLKNDDLLFEDGIIDSAGAITLISLLEECYGIQIYDEELMPENFASIDHMALFIQAKLKRLQPL